MTTTRMISIAGITLAGRPYWHHSMALRVGQKALIDDLGIASSPEVLVTFEDGSKVFAEQARVNPWKPRTCGNFERAYRRLVKPFRR